MFVINLTKENLEYRAHGLVEILKPGMNLIDNTVITSVELKNHFGGFITIVTSDQVKESEEYEKRNLPEPIVPNEGEEVDGDKLIGHPEACQPCFADGKTPTEEECKKCKEDKLKAELEEAEEKGEDKSAEESKAPVVEKKEVKAKAPKAKAKSTKKNK